MLPPYLGNNFFVLNMEAASSSETLVNFPHISRRFITGDITLYGIRNENLKCHILLLVPENFQAKGFVVPWATIQGTGPCVKVQESVSHD
jgi:hypothetical protein